MQQNNIEEAQRVMLSLLEAFDLLCKKNHLTYWLDHGTLLGAVRHHGFIPWDDDLDVTMPRDDYEKFLEVAKQELPENIFLQTKISDPHTPVHYAKLRDRNSTYIDKWEEGRSIRYHQGIFMDIFPVNAIAFEKRVRYKNILNIAKIFSNRYLKIDSIANRMIQYLNGFHNEKNHYIVSGGESMHYVTHINRETVFPLKQIPFEGKEFPAPGDYHSYLVSIFGKNYRELPPEEKRQIHSMVILPKQKCSHEMRQDETK